MVMVRVRMYKQWMKIYRRNNDDATHNVNIFSFEL